MLPKIVFVVGVCHRKYYCLDDIAGNVQVAAAPRPDKKIPSKN